MNTSNTYNVDALRAKLTATPFCDACGGNAVSGHGVECTGPTEYARQLARQNSGLPCEHCGSISGHLSTCGLINREAGEAKRVAEGATLPSHDADFLKAMKVKW